MSDNDTDSYTYKASKLIEAGWRQWSDLDAWFAPGCGYRSTMEQAWMDHESAPCDKKAE